MVQTVMALGAHPDDVEIGAGGTLAALSDAGCQVILVDLTDGEPTPHGDRETRGHQMRARLLIRDDDLSYFTEPARLESLFDGIWDKTPVHFAVIPKA